MIIYKWTTKSHKPLNQYNYEKERKDLHRNPGKRDGRKKVAERFNKIIMGFWDTQVQPVFIENIQLRKINENLHAQLTISETETAT